MKTWIVVVLGQRQFFNERPYWKLGNSLNRQFILSVWRSRWLYRKHMEPPYLIIFEYTFEIGTSKNFRYNGYIWIVKPTISCVDFPPATSNSQGADTKPSHFQHLPTALARSSRKPVASWCKVLRHSMSLERLWCSGHCKYCKWM